jgi:RimJ/RimL family protein N-acetyltransferase
MHPDERSAVVEVTALCFKGFRGHYHADPRLDGEQCDAVYPSWASRCCAGDTADIVLVVEVEGRVAGFSAFRAISDAEGQLVLGAVAPWANGRGLYGQMTLAGAAWCRERGLERLLAVTELGNLPSQRTWANLGMKPSASTYTFHRWFLTE